MNYSFYNRDTVTVARDLLGKLLVHEVNGQRISGIISETEAYGYKNDPASHTFLGKTQRNRAMFGPVGHAYIYFIYGVHYCLNAVARAQNMEAGGVLIRAIVPHEGIEHMMVARNTNNIKQLTNGPGKLVQALGITRDQYGADLINNTSLRIEPYTQFSDDQIIATSRIGISKAQDKLWRFVVRD